MHYCKLVFVSKYYYISCYIYYKMLQIYTNLYYKNTHNNKNKYILR